LREEHAFVELAGDINTDKSLKH